MHPYKLFLQPRLETNFHEIRLTVGIPKQNQAKNACAFSAIAPARWDMSSLGRLPVVYWMDDIPHLGKLMIFIRKHQ